MSFEPITRWTLRCDGTTSRGRCEQRATYEPDPEYDPDPEPTPIVFGQPQLDDDERRWLLEDGWLPLPDGRVLCPAHVAALEYLAWAAVDGLPFDDPTPPDRPGPAAGPAERGWER